MKKLILTLILSIAGVSAQAGRSTAILDQSNGYRVIVESIEKDNGLASLMFFSCTNQIEIKTNDVDLSQCDVMLEGQAFTLPEIVTAIKKNYDRNLLHFFVQDLYQGLRQTTKAVLKKPVDGNSDTTYMGSANSYAFASDSAWLLISIERAITNGDSEEPGLTDVGYFRGARDGLTALLLFADN